MDYKAYGISPRLVRKIGERMQDPDRKERVFAMLRTLNERDLQNRAKVKSSVRRILRILRIPAGSTQVNRLADYIVALEINPRNVFDLMKLRKLFQ